MEGGSNPVPTTSQPLNQYMYTTHSANTIHLYAGIILIVRFRSGTNGILFVRFSKTSSSSSSIFFYYYSLFFRDGVWRGSEPGTTVKTH